MTTKYPQERKEAIINKMLPPQSMSVPEIAQLENIPLGTLKVQGVRYCLKNQP